MGYSVDTYILQVNMEIVKITVKDNYTIPNTCLHEHILCKNKTVFYKTKLVTLAYSL